MRKFILILLTIMALNPTYSSANNSDWKPGFLSCHQSVKAPIANAWRAANYIEEELDEIEKAIKDGEGCDKKTFTLLTRLDELIGTVYDPLGKAILRLPECEDYLHEGLMGLLNKRSKGLEDRLFNAGRTIAKLYEFCDEE